MKRQYEDIEDYDQLTLFGDKVAVKEIKRTKADVFEDYEGFLEKFEAKKTTDDCYTPEPIYQAVVDFVKEHYGIGDVPIVRPFFPGGDYEGHEYPENCVVIDNPPFSILSKICRFYTMHEVPFFLFGPALTLFASAASLDLTYIVCDAQITYANGAVVPTGFITNLDKEFRIWCCPELKYAIENAVQKESKSKRGFVYPDNIVTAATLNKLPAHGVEFKVRKESCTFIKDSDSAKAQGRSLFGGGYLLSDSAASERAAAERAAAERAAAAVTSLLNLSQRERMLIEKLNKREVQK